MSRHSSYNSHASRLTYNSHDLLTKHCGGGGSPVTKEKQLRERSRTVYEEQRGQKMFTEVLSVDSFQPHEHGIIDRTKAMLREIFVFYETS
jgi:hypothetical protein